VVASAAPAPVAGSDGSLLVLRGDAGCGCGDQLKGFRAPAEALNAVVASPTGSIRSFRQEFQTLKVLFSVAMAFAPGRCAVICRDGGHEVGDRRHLKPSQMTSISALSRSRPNPPTCRRLRAWEEPAAPAPSLCAGSTGSPRTYEGLLELLRQERPEALWCMFADSAPRLTR